MNQILSTKISKKIRKHKQFIVIFYISIIAFSCFLFFYIFYEANLEKKHNKSIELSNNYEILKLYSTQNINSNKKASDILGNIIISKLNINYAFFYGYDENLLKALPCRFYGEMPPTKGNLCITAHNYNDNRFFGKISELENNDEIIIEDIFNNRFLYYVYDKYEVLENDLSPLIQYDNKQYTLTLITCNNLNKKRIIIKAKQKA